LHKKKKSSTAAGDIVISNLSAISKRIASGAKASGTRVLDGTYTEILNRIPVDQLIKQTIDCLKSLLTCREMIEGILDKNILLGYGTFKTKLPADKSFLADRALQVAQTGLVYC